MVAGADRLAGDVLDVGCGPGALWETAAALVPPGLRLMLTDLSPGMVAEAVPRAAGTGRFATVIGRDADARALPFADASFDVVVSTYALYHVPEPAGAVRELARVVRPGGTVAVMTNGAAHIAELEQIRVAVWGEAAAYVDNRTFTPQLGAALLIDAFDDVHWHRYVDELACTDVDDVLSFVTSTPPADTASTNELAQARSEIRRRMVDGVLRVTKDTGAFVCRRSRA